MQQQIFYSVKGSRFQEIQDELFSGDLALYDPRVTFGALLGLDGFSRQLTRVL